MKERTALGEQILSHWREHCPRMVRELETAKRLNQAVFEAQEQAGDLIYELTAERKMDYQAAWEMAREEWALPPEPGNPPPSGNAKPPTSSRSRPRRSRRATSGSRKRTGSDKAD